MKKVLLVLGLVLSTTLNAQWVSKNINNGLDDPYKICYNTNEFKDILKMEQYNGGVILYVQDETNCFNEEDVHTDISFFVKGEWIRFIFECNAIDDSAMGLVHNLLNPNNEKLLNSFKLATKIRFRYNYTICEPEVYEFNMSGSTAALNFIKP